MLLHSVLRFSYPSCNDCHIVLLCVYPAWLHPLPWYVVPTFSCDLRVCLLILSLSICMNLACIKLCIPLSVSRSTFWVQFHFVHNNVRIWSFTIQKKILRNFPYYMFWNLSCPTIISIGRRGKYFILVLEKKVLSWQPSFFKISPFGNKAATAVPDQ